MITSNVIPCTVPKSIDNNSKLDWNTAILILLMASYMLSYIWMLYVQENI